MQCFITMTDKDFKKLSRKFKVKITYTDNSITVDYSKHGGEVITYNILLVMSDEDIVKQNCSFEHFEPSIKRPLIVKDVEAIIAECEIYGTIRYYERVKGKS